MNSLTSPSYSGANTSYMFVDGGSLQAVMKKIGDKYLKGRLPRLDWSRIRGGNRKVFYYDAIPVQDHGEDENNYHSRIAPKIAELSSIERQNSCHVRTGDVRFRRKRGNEQKMVDVQLAVDALSMASRGLFSSISIITGDLDFKPLVSALVEMGVEVNLIYPVDETNESLLAAADIATPLNLSLARTWFDEKADVFEDFPSVSFFIGYPFLTDVEEVLSFNHPTEGLCVLHLSEGIYSLVTRMDNASFTMEHLNVTSSNLESLKIYLEEVHNISIP